MEFLSIMYPPYIHFAYGPYYTNLAYPKGIYACFKVDIYKTCYNDIICFENLLPHSIVTYDYVTGLFSVQLLCFYKLF